jgi:peptidoglycan/xylan/chitin deacetylase (PgdA/CDA1 family)
MVSTLSRRTVLVLLFAIAGSLGALTLHGGGATAAVPRQAGEDAGTYTPPFTGCDFRSSKPVRSGPTSGKRIALTFDDGPSAYTSSILKILAQQHIHATFFIQGNHIAGREALLRQMLDEGHMIGNHSFTHPDLSTASADIDGEVDDTTAAIQDATGGFTPCLMRPPYGRTSARLLSKLGNRSLTPIIWNDNPVDYLRPGIAKIKQRILKQAKPGGIIIDHDGGGNRSQTVAAMPSVIKTLKARGYKFVTVTALLGLGTTG